MEQPKPIIFMTGQNGMLGQHLTQSLAGRYQVYGLQREGSSPNNPKWNYQDLLNELEIKAPEAVIHLAGAGIAEKRWSKAYKQTIYDSRISGTQWLVNEILLNGVTPQSFLCASAIGYYGHRPKEVLTEQSSTGSNFVAKIATQWELATQQLQTTKTRVVNMRFGMILSGSGGALKDMLLPFKLGLGGRLGSGQQLYSWISIVDAGRAIQFILDHKTISGPVNLTAPQAVTNQTLTRELARQLHRPAFFHQPSALVRLIFGEVADELLLADCNVLPEKLVDTGFSFSHPELSAALQALLK